MSGAVTRAKKLEHGTHVFTQPAKTGIPGKLEARPVAEVRVTEADRGSISDHGMTPLMRAACDGLAGTVQSLLDRGAEVNAKRSDGFNALALAAFFGHSQVVWLLLENGADLAATGSAETPPELWADARGFLDVGDILREARATKQVEASSPRTAVIDEPARFPRPAEEEKLRRAGGQGPEVEGSVMATTDSDTPLAMRPEPVAEESTEKKNESTADIFPSDKPEPAQVHPVIKQPPRASKTLLEITDPPPMVVPEFHPGSVFVARITSSRKNLVALILAVWLVCGGIAAFLIPQIRTSLADGRKEAVTKTTNLPTEPSSPVAGSGTNVSGTVETPPAATAESSIAPLSKDIDETRADIPINSRSVESTSRFESAEVLEKGSAGNATARESESRAHPNSSTSADSRVLEAHENNREFFAATSTSRPGARARKQRAVSRPVELKQQAVTDEQPKPAPLSVEMSRSRSVLSTPARSADEVSGSQTRPLSIISGKPKSKVIQWP
jgi:hypothetical protein